MNQSLIKNTIAEILFGKILCESLEDRRFVNVVYETINGDLILEKLLVGEPVSIPELRKMLHNKILNFEFIKLDGEIRPARGTTMMKYIPQTDHPKGIRPSSPKVATFYDLDKKAWRSVSQRSKEVVMKYGFGEKKKPVFVIKDKGAEMPPEIEKPTIEKPTIEKPTIEKPEVIDVEPRFDDIDKVGSEDIIDILPVSKPEVEIIEKKPKYGWRPKQKNDIEAEREDLPKPGEIEDVIVKPNIGWRPKEYQGPQKEIKVLLPQPVGVKPDPKAPAPQPITATGPKPPPLMIEPEEEMGI